MQLRSLASLLLASFSGKLIYALSSLLAVPLATHLLGAEAMGVVGFFATVLMVLMVAEGGLTSSIIHRMARSVVASRERATRNRDADLSMVSTYFATFFALGTVVFLGLGCASGWVVEHWLHFDGLGQESVRRSIWYMAAFIGLNFPVMLLQAVLVGKERQMALNAIYVPYSLLRTLGVLLPLYLLPHIRSVDNYFLFQVIVQVAYFLALSWMAYRCTGFLPWLYRWKLSYLRRGYGYGRGVLLISVTSIVTTQYDKFYLSGHISLKSFGYYTLAATLASVAYIFSTAFNSVLFPRMTAYFSEKDEKGLERIHTASLCIVSSALSLLCCAVFLFKDLLLSVLFVPEVASGVSGVVAILMVGTSLQALLIVPFALQLATKWTTLAFRLNLAAIPVILMVLPLLVGLLGAQGAAWLWLSYNVYSVVLTFFFVCKRHSYLTGGVFACLKVIVLSILAGSLFFGVVRFITELATDENYRLAGVILAIMTAGLVSLLLNRKSLLALK
jgi:O-antigen/teichoic acid export membrane protein